MTEIADLAQLAAHRPNRADARRNFDALIAAARLSFAELGTEAPLEEIARRAGVGIGTLYRNFPTREALIESVYVEQVLAVVEAAKVVADLPPWEALMAWLTQFLDYVGTKRALVTALNRDSQTLKACRSALYPAGEPLLKRAQDAGLVRADVGMDDVMRMLSGVAAVNFADAAQRDKVIGMALDGLRTRGAA